MTAVVVPPMSLGVSGDTSASMLNRVGSFALDDLQVVAATPDVALVFGCPNDPVSGLTQSQTQLNIQAIVLALKHGAYGLEYNSGGAYVATVSVLPARGRRGQRYVVLSDTDTTGGATSPVQHAAATITGSVAGSGPAVWEFVRRRVGAAGWRRVAVSGTAPTACKRIVVIGTNYKNYFTNGSDATGAGSAGKRDLVATPEPFYAATRAGMQAAVAAENVAVGGNPTVVYADLYTLQRTLIVGGTFPASGSPTLSITAAAGDVPDFSGGATYDATKDWHYTSGNQHHNEFGHELVALAAFLAIVNAGWITALAALAYINIKALGDSQTDLQAGYAVANRTWVPTLGGMLRAHVAG